MGHRSSRILSSVIAAATLLAFAPAAAAADDVSTLRVAGGSNFDTFNPFNATRAATTDILRLVYDSLVENAAKDNADTAGLAESWKVSDDKLTWTYTMQPDATWSDGKPITSADALWTYDSIMTNPDLQTAFGADVESIASVAAPDKRTFTITMKEPQATNPGNDIWIMPKHVWETKDAATYANDRDVVGSGPFVLKSYDKNAGIELDRNTRFWRGKAGFDRILFIPYKNTDASVQALKNGEVDYVSDLTAAQFNSLKNNPDITTYAANNRRYYSLSINPGAKDADGNDLGDGNAVLHDKRVRQAIVMAIDNKTLIEKAFGGYGQEATGEIPAVYPLYHWDASDNDLTLSYNPDKARKLLDEAGLKTGADGYRTDKDGNPLELRLLVASEYPNWVQMATYVKPWLKEVGLNVKVITESYSQVSDASSVGKYDMYFTGWGIGPDPDWQMSINRCSSRPNADGSGQISESNWCDPEFDKLYARQHVEMDQAKRSSIIKQMQRMIYEAAANDVITYQQALVAYRKDRVTGWTAQPTDGGIYTSQNGYWGYMSAKPVTSGTSGTSELSPAVPIAVAVVVIVVAGVAVVVVRRRHAANADDEE